MSEGRRSADVIVIGGGIHGCSTALHCAMRGLSVILIEKDHAGRHASGVNAGGVRQLARHVAEIPLSNASMALWHNIADLVDDDCGFTSDGQVLVAEDMLGLFERTPRFVKRYGAMADLVSEAAGAYAADVRDRSFPTPDQTYQPKS